MRIKFVDGNITDKNIDGATIVTDSNFVMIEKDNERTYYPLCNIRAIKVSEPKRGEL